MVGFLYTNATLISIIIGIIVGLGVALILLEVRFKRREGLPQFRRNLGLGILFMGLGGLLFCVMLLVDVTMNKTIWNKWALTLTIGCLLSIVFFTILLYFMEKRILRRFWGR